MSAEARLAALDSHLRRIHLIGSTADLLSWDEQVNLPAASTDQRAAQLTLLAELRHTEAASPALGELLAELAPLSAQLTSDQQTILHWARRDYDRATKLPASFVREKADQASRGYHGWAQARAENNFALYQPILEKNLELARREAAYLGYEQNPYDYHLDRHDPGVTVARLAPLFAELKTQLIPLVRTITAAHAHTPPAPLRDFPIAAQADFLRSVTTALGFDYTHGRIDTSLHPFCSGTGADIRMTTRFDVDQPLDSLFSSIHETGHGLYEQGLPADHHHDALGQAAGMAIHESQSRLWENQVSRSRAFWRHYEPRFRATFPAQLATLSSDQLYREINAVRPTLIRVDADEVTYNLHILLRFELERSLFSGTLAVADLPDAWRSASAELLGLTPATDREGVLQDIHWSDGSFGYFPSYCLGNMIAAQLWYRALELRPDLENDFARGDFSWLLNWLRQEIHAHGKRHDTFALVERATSQPLSPRHLLRYLSERYQATP